MKVWRSRLSSGMVNEGMGSIPMHVFSFLFLWSTVSSPLYPLSHLSRSRFTIFINYKLALPSSTSILLRRLYQFDEDQNILMNQNMLMKKKLWVEWWWNGTSQKQKRKDMHGNPTHAFILPFHCSAYCATFPCFLVAVYKMTRQIKSLDCINLISLSRASPRQLAATNLLISITFDALSNDSTLISGSRIKVKKFPCKRNRINKTLTSKYRIID